MGWIKKLLFAIGIAKVVFKEGGKLIAEALQVKTAYLNAVDASSESGRSISKAEWQKIAGESFDVIALLFSWRK